MDITALVHGNREQAFALGDYATYRDQLARQVASLRRKLQIATPKNQKFKHREPITAADIAKDKQYVHLQLLTAERAWAHAMSIKAEHAQDNASEVITGSTRKFVISRLHRAASYAVQLVAAVQDKSVAGTTDQDYLEAQAYARSLEGAVEFEKQFNKKFDDAKAQKAAWKSCLTSFSEAHVIYSSLLHATQKETFKEVVAGTIDPSIRYAAYQSRLSRTVPIPTVAKQYLRQDQPFVAQVQALDPNALTERKASLTAATVDGTTTMDIPTEISWRGRSAPIADAAIGTTMAAALIAADHLHSQLASLASAKALAAAYDPVLTAAQDTVDAVRRALADLTKEGVPESDSRVQDLRVSDLAANYELIAWRIGRNRVLISSSLADFDDGLLYHPPTFTPKVPRSKKSKSNGAASAAADTETTPAKSKQNPASRGQRLAALRDRATLLASTLQSLDAIAALPGASRDASFVAEIDGQRSYFRALRCLNIAYAHQTLGPDHHSQALALFARAAESAQAATANAAGGSKSAPALQVSPAQVKRLQDHARLATARQQGLVALSQTQKAPSGSAAPLITNMNHYPSGGVDLKNIVPIPPRLEPVPVKPVFLDIAWNYITYPGQTYEPSGAADTEMEDASKEGGEKRKSGWFGGLLGR